MSADDGIRSAVVGLLADLDARIALVKDRVIAADKAKADINSAYHGGEIAGLHFKIERLRAIADGAQ